MRIGIISDLHVDDSPSGVVVEAASRAVREASVDLLVVPGDFSSDWRTSLDAIRGIEDAAGVRMLFVPGNHDLWNRKHPDETPEYAHERLCEHPGCLSGRRVAVGDWTFVGETGWYDGSLAEGRFSTDEIAAMRYGGRTWQDSRFTRWNIPMAEKAAEHLSSLESSLRGLDPERTVVVTHVVPRLEFTVQPPIGIWTFFNGLLGSAAYGALFAKTRVRAALCGHVHYRKRFESDGVEWICACLGTPGEWSGDNAVNQARAALAVLEL